MTEEKLDILDENGSFTGKTAGYTEVHEKGLWHRAVVLHLVNSKNQVLLQRRSASKKTYPNLWTVSVGGHVVTGELGEAACVREAAEEVGLTINPKDIRYICGYRSDTRYSEKLHNRHFNEYFVAYTNAELSEIKLQDGEVTEAEWLDYDYFKSLVEARDAGLTPYWEAFESLIRYIDSGGIVPE